MVSDSGLIYIATGKNYFEEALHNISISKNYAPNLPVTLVTNKDLADRHLIPGIDIKSHPNPVFSYRDKIAPLVNLPYKRTLFLDSDASLIVSPSDLFSSFITDVAGAHAPVRIPPGWRDNVVPHSFPEVNTGVLLFRRSRMQRRLIRCWLSLYDYLKNHCNQTWDQASFRSVLWKFLVKYPRSFTFCVLPSECNLRTTKPWIAGRGLPVSVVHGRYPDSERSIFIDYLNKDIDRFRTWSEWISLHPYSKICPRHDRTFG